MTSVINAVAKASSLLRDGLGLPPGSVVRVDLPRHWQLPIWVWAALSVGATVGRGMTGPADVRIIGPEGLAEISLGADLGPTRCSHPRATRSASPCPVACRAG